ncbi:MAG: type I 3-dehydroquinate dehydratase [Chloroflexi bacterium]|nr:type I 3-dehydroquinate dehydratase [Chloroflexota bacterium]
MKTPRICAVVLNSDLRTIKSVEPLADLFEVRIDLIGDGWEQVVEALEKPWIACNRTPAEGGRWLGTESERTGLLLRAAQMGAAIIDIELSTPNLENIVKTVKQRTKCLVSYHDLEKTPPIEEMKDIVRRQIKAGADVCKVVTTARNPEDNLTVLELVRSFPETTMVAFAMGPLGLMSRVLCPLAGGYFTYVSIERGKESAQGQMTVHEMKRIYGMITA